MEVWNQHGKSVFVFGGRVGLMGKGFESETGAGWFLKSGKNEGEHELTHPIKMG